MSRKAWLLCIVCLLTLGLDQGSKALVRAWPVGLEQVWIPGLVTTVHLQNPGGVLGLAASWPLALKLGLFGAAAIGMCVVAGLWLHRVPRHSWLVPIGLGSLLGGAVGNSADRLILGGVTDFIVLGRALVQPWLPLLPWIERTPAFNLADVFLGAGICMLAISVLWTTLGQTASAPGSDPS